MNGLTKHLTDIKVSVPVALLVGLVWLGFKADDISIQYLDRFFVTDVQAQEITDRVIQLEGKVDGLGKKIDENRVTQIEREVFDLRIKQCTAEGALRTLYANQLAKLVSEWRALTKQAGEPSSYVDCDDVG
jgi:hypothetical protein